MEKHGVKLEKIYKDYKVYDPHRKFYSIYCKLADIRNNKKYVREGFKASKYNNFLDLVDANDGKTYNKWTLEDDEMLVSLVERFGMNLAKICEKFEVYDSSRTESSIRDKLHDIRGRKATRHRFKDEKYKRFLEIVDTYEGNKHSCPKEKFSLAYQSIKGDEISPEFSNFPSQDGSKEIS